MLAHDIIELFNTSLMIKKPMLIVEGIDDIKFYAEICNKIKENNFDVYAIENIPGYSEGNNEVIRAIIDMQVKINEKIGNEKYILGIIDADARFFRNEVPKLDCLFILKYYSYESHYITESNLRKFISGLTYWCSSDLDDQHIEIIFDKIKKDMEYLYYCSLEALQNAVDSNYVAEIGYSTEPGMLYSNANIKQTILCKKDELDKFASSFKIDLTIENIKRISKGKWLIFFFIKSVMREVISLKNLCQTNLIKQCQSCLTNNKTKCLWRTKVVHNDATAKEVLLGINDNIELTYIYNRIKKLYN